MNTIFIVEVVWLFFRPVCEIIGLIICPGEIALCDPIVQTNPTLSTIQPMLNINVFFLIPYGDEVGAVCPADFLSFGPIFA